MPVQNEQESTRLDALTHKKRQLAQVNKLASQYFHQVFLNLPASHPAKAYAEKRKLNSQIVSTFQVGYATEEWDGLVKFLESKKIPMELAEEARLVKARSNGKSGYFDIFRDRLMFPIFSTMGEPIAFGGRIINQGEPKYLNSPETLVFHKGRVLYGLSETAKFIRTEDQAIVVEGYMDLVSLYQSGICNVVATMGTALTMDHGKLLDRMTKNVVVLFDGDRAGQEAAERSLPLLLASGVYPKGFILPDNQDPDDFVKAHGPEALKQVLAKAPDLFTMILGSWMAGYRGEASEKVKLSNLLQPIFAAISDNRLKFLYLSEAAQKMNVEENWLRQALTSNKPQGQKPVEVPVSANLEPKIPEVSRDQIQLKGASAVESMLLSLVFKNHANFDLFLEAESLPDIPHSGVQDVLKRATEVYRQAPEKFDKLTSLLASFVDRPELLIADHREDVSVDDSRLLLDCFRKLREQRFEKERKTLTLELKSSSGQAGSGGSGAEKYQELLKALTDLKKEEMNLRTHGFTLKKKEP